jgi:hypothetical protein
MTLQGRGKSTDEEKWERVGAKEAGGNDYVGSFGSQICMNLDIKAQGM